MKMKILRMLLLSFMLIAFSSCSSEEPPSESKEEPLEENNVLTDTEVQTLENAGIAHSKMENMVNAIANQEYPNIHSVLIVKDKNLVFEKYFPGNDENWGYDLGGVNHSVSTLHDLRSITKSVVATCIGIALKKGEIESLDQNIFDFFPEYQQYNSGQRSQIIIKDLLTMTPGMQWDETNIPYTDPTNPEIQLTNSEDPIAYVLSNPIINTPGEVFKYNGGATQLLAEIIANVSGMEVNKYVEEFLFKPLGIKYFEWHLYPNSSLPAATSGLRLRSRDLMKFGLLYQNKGNWDGDQILPEFWIAESFKKQIEKPAQENGFFGYHFHIPPSFTNIGKTIQHVAALGNGDQRIFFNEEDDLMVVITAGNYNDWKTKNSLALMKDFIYPSML